MNYCHHINPAGAVCRGIPVKKRDYCYWHLNEAGRRMKAARGRARSERITIQLPVLDDLHAVQVGLMQLGEAVAHGEIDDRRGRLLLAVLRLAASNIKAQGGWLDEPQMHDSNDTAYASEGVSFEERYSLPKTLDLSLDPEVAFPPPAPPLPQPGGPGIASVEMSRNGAGAPYIPAVEMSRNGTGAPYIPAVGMYGNDTSLRSRLGQILRNAATPIPGVDIRATADDMELMDVYEHQGEQAGLKRAAVLERNRMRRESRERRIRYEEMARNRNIQLAAEKLFIDQQRQAGAVPQGSAEAPISRKPPQSDGTGSSTKAAQGGA